MDLDRRMLLETQEIAAIGSWEWYVEPDLVVWTPELYRIHGLTPDQFESTYQAFFDLVHPDDREHVQQVVSRALESGEPFVYDHRIVTPAGEVRTLQSRGRVERDEEGRIVRFAGTCQDVTKRRRAESEAAKREARLRLLLDQIPAVLWTTDLDLRTTSLVGAALPDLGLEPDETVGLHLYDQLGTDDPSYPPVASHLRALEGESTSYSMEWGGKPFRTRIDPLRDEDGDVVGVIGLSLDLTDIEEARRALREAHENYRSLIEAIPAISYIDSLGKQVRTIYVSPQVEDILGFSPAAIRRGFWASRLHPEDRDEVVAARKRCYARGESFSAEYRVVTAEGRAVWINDQAVIVRDEEGSPVFAQGIMYDITERKRLEEQLALSQKMDALGRLAGGIAHDFNNVLTAILGNAQLVLDGSVLDEETRLAVSEIHEAAELGAELVHQLLGFSRSRMAPEKVFDLREVVTSVEGLLRRLVGEDVVLTTLPGPQRLPVRAELAQLTQVLLNLVINAREAMPNGGQILVEVLSGEESGDDDVAFVVGRESAEAGPFACLRVSDTGVGVHDADRPRLFEPFFTTKQRDSSGGTGLGLSTVYGIVTRTGGFLSVTSRAGAGTSISAYFPISDEGEEASVEEVLAPSPRVAGRILVVEDDERVRRMACATLRRCGYEVLEAADGDSALEAARRQDIDAVLTDVVMPGMSGPELVARLWEDHPDLGVLYMSGYTEEPETYDSVDQHVEFLPKPFTRDQLDAKIQAILAPGGRG